MPLYLLRTKSKCYSILLICCYCCYLFLIPLYLVSSVQCVSCGTIKTKCCQLYLVILCILLCLVWFPQSITWGSSDKLMYQLNCSNCVGGGIQEYNFSKFRVAWVDLINRFPCLDKFFNPNQLPVC